MAVKILLVGINSKFIHSNLALRSLRAYAVEYKDCIEIAEYTINQETSSILSDIYLKRPDVVAFSCYIWNIEVIVRLTRELSKLNPALPIWLGGPEVSYNCQSFLLANPNIAGILVGEGEMIFAKLCEYYCKNHTQEFLHDIKGLYINGDFESYKPNDSVLCMDDLPFAYDDLDELKNHIIYYESSRGCPFSCSYCLSSVDKCLRFKSLDMVKEELKQFIDRNVPQVKFVDRTFNCNEERTLEIWEFILENQNGITNFHFEIAADLITERELEVISRMPEGLIQLEVGVQSTNLKTIEAIHRVTNLEKLRSAVDRINKFKNTHIHLDLIAGLPYEDIESFKKSFDDVFAMKPAQLQLGFLKVLKGAPISNEVGEYEIAFTDYPPYEVLMSKWLKYEELLKLKQIEQMVEIYYNSGQFKNTLLLLEKSFDSAYEMFQKLADYYSEKGYFVSTPSRIYRYNILMEFAVDIDPVNEGAYRQLLTVDAYLRENLKRRPEYAYDMSEYKEVLRMINPERLFHIEIIDKKIVDLIGIKKKENSQELENCIVKMTKLYDEDKRFVIFNYGTRSKITNDAEIVFI